MLQYFNLPSAQNTKTISKGYRKISICKNTRSWNYFYNKLFFGVFCVYFVVISVLFLCGLCLFSCRSHFMQRGGVLMVIVYINGIPLLSSCLYLSLFSLSCSVCIVISKLKIDTSNKLLVLNLR